MKVLENAVIAYESAKAEHIRALNEGTRQFNELSKRVAELYEQGVFPFQGDRILTTQNGRFIIKNLGLYDRYDSPMTPKTVNALKEEIAQIFLDECDILIKMIEE